MTTLPATIPGLLRHCSPITANVAGWGKVSGVVRESGGQLWAHVAAESGSAFLPQRLDAYPFELDLTDPTGFDHAARYVADTICKKAGWPVPVSVMVCHQHGLLVGLWLSLAFEGTTDGRQIFCYSRENGGDRIMDKRFCGGIPTYCTTVIGVAKTETAAEALRLAVLKVAGVQS